MTIKELNFVIAANNKNHLVRECLQEKLFKKYFEGFVFSRESMVMRSFFLSMDLKGDNFDLIGEKMFDIKNKSHIEFVKGKKIFIKSNRCMKISYKNIYLKYNVC